MLDIQPEMMYTSCSRTSEYAGRLRAAYLRSKACKSLLKLSRISGGSRDNSYPVLPGTMLGDGQMAGNATKMADSATKDNYAMRSRRGQRHPKLLSRRPPRDGWRHVGGLGAGRGAGGLEMSATVAREDCW
jgi:hypothetical protein